MGETTDGPAQRWYIDGLWSIIDKPSSDLLLCSLILADISQNVNNHPFTPIYHRLATGLRRLPLGSNELQLRN